MTVTSHRKFSKSGIGERIAYFSSLAILCFAAFGEYLRLQRAQERQQQLLERSNKPMEVTVTSHVTDRYNLLPSLTDNLVQAQPPFYALQTTTDDGNELLLRIVDCPGKTTASLETQVQSLLDEHPKGVRIAFPQGNLEAARLYGNTHTLRERPGETYVSLDSTQPYITGVKPACSIRFLESSNN